MNGNDFSIIVGKHSLEDWHVINDSVMGGLSSGNTQKNAKTLIFSGNVSIESNGGFTSVYTKTPRLSEHVKSVKIALIGDGNNYQLRLRTQSNGRDIIYKIDFNTVNDQQDKRLQTLRFDFIDFEASFRGRIISDAPALKASSITEVGFLILSKQNKSFSLSVHEIDFY